MKYNPGDKVWTLEVHEVTIVKYVDMSVDCCDYGITEPGYLVSWEEEQIYGKEKLIWRRKCSAEYMETELYEGPRYPILNRIKKLSDLILECQEGIRLLQGMFDKYYPQK